MGYASEENVEGEFKKLSLTTTTFVTSTTLATMLEDADALIDSYVGSRYQVPITATASLNLMRLYATVLVRDRIKPIFEVRQTTNTGANQNPRGSAVFDTSAVMKELQKIRDGELDLAGATLLTQTGAFSSGTLDEEYTFQKNKTQW